MRKLSMILVFVLITALFAGCAASEKETAYVQSVSMVCGIGSVGFNNRYSGVVSARSEATISKSEEKTIDEIFVAEGDEVTEGQVLFTYDLEQAALALEKGKLELEQMKATVLDLEAQKEQLEKGMAKASSKDKLSYQLEIQTCETSIRETNYNITLKEKELVVLENAVVELEVYAPVTGRIKSMNVDGSAYDMNGNPKPFMTILESGAYRVKGTINETNAGSLPEGSPVIIRSRVDDQTWTGFVSYIDWGNPTNNSNGYYYGGSSDSQSSTYPFYIELDDSEGLLLGQHVYIELTNGASEETVGLPLPAMYVMDRNENTGYVWVEGKNGKLEKRTVTISVYQEETEICYISDGLTADDYIAFPAENLKAGMLCSENDESAFNVSDMPPMTTDVIGGTDDDGFVVNDGYVGEDGNFDEDIMPIDNVIATAIAEG